MPAVLETQQQRARGSEHQARRRSPRRGERERAGAELPTGADSIQAVQCAEGIPHHAEMLQCSGRPQHRLVVGWRKQDRCRDRREQRASVGIDARQHEGAGEHHERTAEIHQQPEVEPAQCLHFDQRCEAQRREPMLGRQHEQIGQLCTQRRSVGKIKRYVENRVEVVVCGEIHRIAPQHRSIRSEQHRGDRPADRGAQCGAIQHQTRNQTLLAASAPPAACSVSAPVSTSGTSPRRGDSAVSSALGTVRFR